MISVQLKTAYLSQQITKYCFRSYQIYLYFKVAGSGIGRKAYKKLQTQAEQLQL